MRHPHGGEFPEVRQLFVDSIDKAFLLQFHYDAVVENFIYLEGCAGFARQRLLDLDAGREYFPSEKGP